MVLDAPCGMPRDKSGSRWDGQFIFIFFNYFLHTPTLYAMYVWRYSVSILNHSSLPGRPHGLAAAWADRQGKRY